MKRREIMILTGVIAALASAGTPSQAGQRLGADVGGIDVGAHADVGSNSGVRVDVGIGGNSGSSARGNVGVDVGHAATATANVGIGRPAVGGAVAETLSADVNVDLDGSKPALRATVDLNGDGIINTDDNLLVSLDLNGDGILSEVELGKVDTGIPPVRLGNLPTDVGTLPVDVGKLPIVTITLPGGDNPERHRDVAMPGPGIPIPVPGGPGRNPGAPGGGPDNSGGEIGRVLGNLNDGDLAAYKLKCADVMGNPGGFDAATVKVCRVLASL